MRIQMGRDRCALIGVLVALAVGAVARPDRPCHAGRSLPIFHPKYRTARSVYDRLVRAIGSGRPAPVFQLRPKDAPGPRMVAQQFSGRGGKVLVILEEEAYDVCAEFGNRDLDALAFLLGHELAHFYRDHGWVNDFGVAFEDLGLGQAMRKFANEKEQVAMETEADLFGGFYAHVAGFRTDDVAPRLLEKIYSAYGFGAALRGYPALAERRAIAERSARRLREKFIPVFDAGVRLALLQTALNRNYEAARCFDTIAREFPSREILNNAGVVRAVEAVQLSRTGRRRFLHPFELDADTRLRARTEASVVGRAARGLAQREQDEALRLRLLNEAKTLFERASAIDPDYPTALVNLASVYELLGKAELAVAFANEAYRVAIKTGEELTGGNALIVRGIAQASAGSDTKPEAAFTAAKQSQASLATFNLHTLNPTAFSFPFMERPVEKRAAMKPETIAGLSAAHLPLIEAKPDREIYLLAIDWNSPLVKIAIKRTKEYDAFLVSSGSGWARIIATRPGYPGKTHGGIGLGSTLAAVQDAYGQATHLVRSRQATHHLYTKAKIAFAITARDEVAGWMLYDSSE